MKEITVIVSGETGVGKSTIAEAIRQALAIIDVDVRLVDDNGTGVTDEAPGVIAASLSERLDSLQKSDVRVVVQTRQVRKASREEA